MKITDVLMKLLATEDDNVNDKASTAPERDGRPDPAADRPLPDWVRRSNEHGLAADTRAAADTARESELAIVDTAATPVEVEKPEPEADDERPFWFELPQDTPVPESVFESVAVEEPKPEADVESPFWFDQPQDTPIPESVFESVAVEEPEPVADEAKPYGFELSESAPAPQAVFTPAEAQAPERVADEERPYWSDLSETTHAPEAVAEPAFTAAELERHDTEPDDADEPGTELALPEGEFAHLEFAARLVESQNLGYHLGSAVERIAAAAKQGSDGVPALQEAAWLIGRYIELLGRRPIGADLHLSAARLARTGDAIAGMKALAEALVEVVPTDEPQPAKPEPLVESQLAADPEPPAAEASLTNSGEASPTPPGDDPESPAVGQIRRLSLE